MLYHAALYVPADSHCRGAACLKLVMDYIPGALTIMDVLKVRKGAGIPEKIVASIILQVVMALDHVHKSGYVYVVRKSTSASVVACRVVSLLDACRDLCNYAVGRFAVL